MRYSVLAMQANNAGAAGEIDRALDLVEEVHKIPENELSPAVIGFVADQEMYTRFEAGQWDLCEAAARKAARIFEESGDVWPRADVDMGLFWQPLDCGQPAQAERLILEAIPRAEQVGHDIAKQLLLGARTGVYIADGSLQSAERAAREALAFGQFRHLGWRFVFDAILGGTVLYLDQIEEALSLLTKAAAGPTTHFRGFPEGLLALGMSAAEMEGARMPAMPRFNSCRGREPAGDSERGTPSSA